jgi:hypothetical protein
LGRWLIQHQSRHAAATKKMRLQNLIDIVFVSHMVPNALRVNHDTGTEFASIQAGRGVYPSPGNAELFCPNLHMVSQAFRSARGTAAFWVAIWTPVHADENMEVKIQRRIIRLSLTHHYISRKR